MASVLVTGGTGIVGVHTLLELASRGLDVRALCRERSDRRTVDRIFRHYHSEALLDRIEWVPGDLDDIEALKDAMLDIEQVYHAAALVSFDPRDDHELDRVNRVGTSNVVNAALLSGVRRMVHVSSTATIGEDPSGGIRHEDLQWSDAPDRSPYARSKHAAELEVYRGIAEGLDAVVVNPCVVIGPGAAGRSSMTIAERLRRGTRHYPPGKNAFVDARDVAACMVQLMTQGKSGERYLLVGENARYQDLFTAFAHSFGHAPPVRRIAPWMLALAWRAERVRRLFGGRPFITRHTAASAVSQRAYASEKIRALTGHRFRSLEEMVDNVAAYLTG